jgi:hypothetical protein
VAKSEVKLICIAGRDSVRVEALGAYQATVSEGDWVSVVSTAEYLVFDYEENPDEEDRYAMELVEEDPERYAVMPTKYEIHEYRIMESFVKSLETSDAQSRLDNAIHGIRAAESTKRATRYREHTKAVDTTILFSEEINALETKEPIV